MAFDARHRNNTPHSQTSSGAPRSLWLLIAVMAAIELTLTLSDSGFIGSPDWRAKVFLLGAFWPPLLEESLAPIYRGQRILMFASHTLLHGSLLHFVMNGTILLALGKTIAAQIGPAKALLLFIFSGISGAAAFGFLTTASIPMIGASGAVFGFLGLWQAWEFQRRYRLGQPMRPLLVSIFGLILVNVVLYVAFKGIIAWEAHLGGWLFGWVAAWTFASLSKAR